MFAIRENSFPLDWCPVHGESITMPVHVNNQGGNTFDTKVKYALRLHSIDLCYVIPSISLLDLSPRNGCVLFSRRARTTSGHRLTSVSPPLPVLFLFPFLAFLPLFLCFVSSEAKQEKLISSLSFFLSLLLFTIDINIKKKSETNLKFALSDCVYMEGMID